MKSMNGIIQGAKTIGMFSAAPPVGTLPPSAEDPNEILQTIISKVDALQTLVEGKADASRIKTLIRYSDEEILIQAKEIALRGNLTILDIENDRTGVTPGAQHPSLTRIRGGVIQTGVIISSNWGTSAGSAYDLDNGTITIGGSSAPKLKFDGTDLEIAGTIKAGSIIAGSVTLNSGAGETLTSIQNNAQAGFNIQQALEVSGTTVLKGVLVPTDSGALKTGTITWNSTTGALTGGTGVAITEFGIIGAASGSPTFTINASTGAATFAGSLAAATGTFAGSISAASGTFTGSLVTSGQVSITGQHTIGTQAAALHVIPSTPGTAISADSSSATTPCVTFRNTSTGYVVLAQSVGGAGIAVFGASSGGAGEGVWGVGSGTGSRGVVAQNTSSAEIALDIITGRIEKPRVTGHLIHVYAPGGAEIAGSPFEYAFSNV